MKTISQSPRFTATRDAPIGSHSLAADSTVRQRPGWYQLITPSDSTTALNEVVRSETWPAGVDPTIDQVCAEYAGLGVPFKWCVFPWAAPEDLPERLRARGSVHWWARGMSIATGPAPPLVRIHVEPVTARLGDAFATVYAAVWGGTETQARSTLASALASPSRAFFLASAQGRPIGIAGTLVGQGSAYLTSAGVLPDARGQGAYRAMVAFRLDALSRAGIPFAVTHAREQSSAPILERLGFRTEFRYQVHRLGP